VLLADAHRSQGDGYADVRGHAQVPETVLADHSYHAADVHQWASDISAQCLKQLKGVANGNAGFKFIGKRLFIALVK
jgi:hypothetical protein